MVLRREDKYHMEDSYQKFFIKVDYSIKSTSVISDHDLGTCTENIINGRMMGYMKIVSKVII